MTEIEKEIISKLKKAKKIALFAHVRLDGDAIGSMSGLFFALKAVGKECDMYINEPLPLKFKNVWGAKEFRRTLKTKDYDLLVALDTFPSDRLGKFQHYFINHENTIRIDHHFSEICYAKTSFVDIDRSSTSEIVLDFLKLMHIKIPIEAANCLFMGIVTDTGCFQFTNVNIKTMKAAEYLMNIGVERSRIIYRYFQKKSRTQLKIERIVLENSTLHKNGVGSSWLKFETINHYEARKSDVPGLASMLLQTEGVKIAFMVYEEIKNEFVISCRSYGSYSAKRVCEALGGGGHENAAGAVLHMQSIKQALNKVYYECSKEIERCQSENETV